MTVVQAAFRWSASGPNRIEPLACDLRFHQVLASLKRHKCWSGHDHLVSEGESSLTYILTIIGELVLGGHQHTSRPRRGRPLDVQREAWQWALNR
jgi:hypothetical protein